MIIQPISNNISMQGAPAKPNNSGIWKRIKQFVLDASPTATFKDDPETVNRMLKRDEFCSHPAKNRLIMGATAIVTQPFIDSRNKRVDEETREVSIIRTISKIIAGTTVGIIVRGACHNIVSRMTDLNSTKKHARALIPKDYIPDFIKNSKFLVNYKSALSTGLAICAMCFTNFAIDAPLTVWLTNKANKHRLAMKQQDSALGLGGKS